MDILEYAVKRTTEYIGQMPKALRKKCGQFFTSKETAIFMAELFSVPDGQANISILDPGAGSGILSIALIKRLQTVPFVEKIRLVCYETDPRIIGLLKENLDFVKEQLQIDFVYQIVPDNYIISQMPDYNRMMGAIPNPQKYDMIIGNPPYKKISKDAPEALAMPDICYGTPNLYALFAEMSLFNLKPNAELVYIIPRSWTSGAYFKKFREKFLSECVLEHIHLFVSRDKIFENESVLQEIMIIKAKKAFVCPDNIVITTTEGNADFCGKTTFAAPYTTVINAEDHYVYLVTSEEEVKVLKQLNAWSDTLPSIGLKMRTGLTVDFRSREELRDKEDDQTVPLFYSQHIQDGKVIFPIGKECEYLATTRNGLLQKNTNYLFVKRFTAKEEHRRLQCGIYLSRKQPKYQQISTQNKINFICGLHDLSECVVYGLYVLFNSTIYDCYYRILNGSTQVNSTEVNSMPVPPMYVIESMGKKLIQSRDMSEISCDNILRSYI